MIVESKCGNQYVVSGSENALRSSITGEIIVQQQCGRYTESVLRGNVYTAYMQSVAAMGTGLNQTVTTIMLNNPAGSGINASILEINGAVMSAAAAIAWDVLAVSATAQQAAATFTTQITAVNALLSQPASSKVTAWSSSTTGVAPLCIKALATTLAASSVTAPPLIAFDIGGAIVMPPNTQLTIQGINTAHNGIWGFTWEEVPIVFNR